MRITPKLPHTNCSFTTALEYLLKAGGPCKHSFKQAEMAEGHCCCQLSINFHVEQFQKIGPKYIVLSTRELGFPISHDRTGATTYLRNESLPGA